MLFPALCLLMYFSGLFPLSFWSVKCLSNVHVVSVDYLRLTNYSHHPQSLIFPMVSHYVTPSYLVPSLVMPADAGCPCRFSMLSEVLLTLYSLYVIFKKNVLNFVLSLAYNV